MPQLRRLYLHLASVPTLCITASPERVLLDYRTSPNGAVHSVRLTRREARHLARDLLELTRVPREARP